MTSWRLNRCFAMAMGITTAIAGAAMAQDSATSLVPINVKLDSAYVSKYVWRGIQQTNDSVFQPAVTLSGANGLSYNVWANVNSSANPANGGKLTEVDHTFNYSYAVKKLALNSGLIYYMFPNTTGPSTAEAYTSMCFGGILSPALAVNYDFAKADGAYFSLSGGYNCSMPWMKKIASTLTLSAKVSYATAGYNNYWFFGTNKSAFTDYLLTASLPFTVGKGISIVPSINYNSVIDSQLRNAVEDAGLDANNLYGGLAMSYAF